MVMLNISATQGDGTEGDPFAPFLRDLMRVSQRVEDFRPAWDVIAEQWRDVLDGQFTSYGQGAWPELSPRYDDWKQSVRPGRPIMVFDGTLRKQLTVKGGGGVEVYQPKTMVLGTRLPYAAAHQGGVTGRLPKRELVPRPTEAQVRQWTKVLQRHIVEGLE